MPIPGTKYGLRDLPNSFSRVRSDRFRSLVCAMAEQGRQASDFDHLVYQTELCTRDLGPGLATPFVLSSLVPHHREDSDVAQAGPSTDDISAAQRPARPFVSQRFQLLIA